MIEISTNTLRSSNNRQVSATFSNVRMAYDSLHLEFFDGSKNIEIISTTHGFIQGRELIIFTKSNRFTVVLDHFVDTETVKCIMHVRTNGIVNIEEHIIRVPSLKAVKPRKTEVREVQTGLLWPTSSQEISDGLKAFGKSDWKLKLSNSENVVVELVNPGRRNINVAFGDCCSVLSQSDFVFSMCNNDSTVTIPKEIVWLNHKYYKGQELMCCEVVSVDCHPLSNIFYKVPISNRLLLSDLPKKTCLKLRDFTTPTGVSFNHKHWVVDTESNLPRVIK